jgi:hypothetical protein
MNVQDLVTHFALAWYFHLAQGGKNKNINGFARGWLRRVRGAYTSPQAVDLIKSVAGTRSPGHALMIGYYQYKGIKNVQ